MKKILLLTDGLKVEKHAILFACSMAKLTGAKLTIALLEDTLHRDMIFSGEDNILAKIQIEKNAGLLKEECTEKNVNFNIHRDCGLPAKEAIMESRFSDVMIIPADISFERRQQQLPGDFLKYVLRNSECPVIVAPETFTKPEDLIFCYDGSSSSVFAIKQFSALFPQYRDIKTTVLHVTKKGDWALEEKARFSEWLGEYYSNLHFETLNTDSATGLMEFLYRRDHTFIVMGAYSRSRISDFFVHSHADLLIKTMTQPIFIAHL